MLSSDITNTGVKVPHRVRNDVVAKCDFNTVDPYLVLVLKVLGQCQDSVSRHNTEKGLSTLHLETPGHGTQGVETLHSRSQL